ncbi:ABC transporter permease [Rhodopila globiformis]|uniref:ABC transporter n=1 Tax=Rhodopila globiformis TaxID=1071 RepID=A0A2S6N0T8_RHOGL|nr:ABC transporter permease [Rhodopila globiformis]PPQ28209.1 ABC transporter [Rhodopila globiformis]
MSTAVTTLAPAASLDLKADMSVASRHSLAVDDLVRGFGLWRLAWTLGWLDIRLRYRGSMLGPFWLTISTGVMVGALGVLYSTLFKMDVASYLPFLALSQVLWGFLGALVSEACTSFTEAENVIRSVRMPFFVYSVRTLIRNIIVLAHNILVILVVFAWFRAWPGWDLLLAIPGMLIWIADALALTLLLGAFCARFRDIQPIVNSVMQIMFFVTPVIWKPEQLGAAGMAKLPLNPFFDLLEIVRGPLLDTGVSGMTWLGALGYSAALCSIAWAFFVRARGRITFWI